MGDENVQNVGIIVNQLIEICDREVIVYKKSEAKHIADGHPYITPPTMPVKPNAAFQRTRFARR